MKPKAWLKSLKMKVLAIASRPATSAQPGSSLKADFRASADSRSAMIASVFQLDFALISTRRQGLRRRPWPAGNHDADVTPSAKEICYNMAVSVPAT
jgi:hypothetical protein